MAATDLAGQREKREIGKIYKEVVVLTVKQVNLLRISVACTIYDLLVTKSFPSGFHRAEIEEENTKVCIDDLVTI